MSKRADYAPAEYFYDEYEAEQAERNEALSGNIGNYRTKTIKCGKEKHPKLIEVDVYPILKRGVKREGPAGKTSEAQRKVNHRNVQRKITQILNANFWDLSNVWVRFGYEDKFLPVDFAEANRNLQNYFRKLKRLIERVNEIYWKSRQYTIFEDKRVRITRAEFETALAEYRIGNRLKANFIKIATYLAHTIDKPIEPLKYIYVTEVSQKGRFHHHIVMNFPERDVIESLWKFEKYSYTKRVQPDEDFGLGGLAFYISKDYGYKKEYEKSYGYSQNLYLPHNHSTISDRKVSKKQAAEIATCITKAHDWFAKKYQGYEFLEAPEVRTNEYFGGYWIYARLRKKEGGCCG